MFFLGFLRLAFVFAAWTPTDDQRPASNPSATTQPAAATATLAGREWPVRELDLSAALAGYDGCFVLLDAQHNEARVYNRARCAERFSPCSTFKIPNALIGLETGVLSGPDHLLAWDGVQRDRPELNHDHNLRSAIKDSVVWYFQKVAAGVGTERMQTWLDRMHYGNRDISGGLTQFWLGASLKISAFEQLEFIDRLRRGDLPFAPANQATVRELIVIGTENGATLRGKTGTLGGENGLGWFVGYTVRGEQTWPFAMNISGGRDATGPKTRELCIAILKANGWY